MQETSLSFPGFLHSFLFQTVSVRGFRWMRSVWALVTFAIFLAQWQDVSLYYGAGTVPFYFLLLISLLCVFLNVQTRSALVVAFLLFTFFLHRNPLPFGGGELLLHNVGFLLMVVPISTFNFPFGTMPIWPYRLLLFQIIVLYVSSAWQKLLGTTWLDGSALVVALVHPHFARFPSLFTNIPTSFFSLVSPLIVVWEFSWLLLLLPRQRVLKHLLLLSGTIFHLAILLFLKVGSFSAAMLTAYLGLVFWRETLPRGESQASSG